MDMRLESTLTAVAVDQTNTPNNTQDIESGKSWDTELFDFVNSNKDTIVDCPWQPGAKMTLSDAMNGLEDNGYPALREDTLAIYFEIALQLLTDSANKEAEEQLKKAQEDEALKPETADVANETAPARKNDTPSESSQNKKLAAKTTKSDQKGDLKAEVKTSLLPGEVYGEPERAQLSTNESEASAGDPISIVAAMPEVPTTTRTTYAPSASNLNTVAEPYLSPKIKSIPSLEPIVDTHFEPVKIITRKELVTIDAEEVPRTTTEFVTQKTDELTQLDIVVDATDGQEDEVFVCLETDPVLEAFDYEYEADNPDQLMLVDVAEIEPSDLALAQDTLTEMAEKIEIAKTESVQKIDEILYEIIELPTIIQLETNDDVASETEIHEDLIQLFAEVLDILDIDHTPELLESLAQLTLDGHFAIRNSVEDSEDDHLLQSGSTRKIVKQLFVALTITKLEATQACAVGKYALQHFGLSIA